MNNIIRIGWVIIIGIMLKQIVSYMVKHSDTIKDERQRRAHMKRNTQDKYPVHIKDEYDALYFMESAYIQLEMNMIDVFNMDYHKAKYILHYNPKYVYVYTKDSVKSAIIEYSSESLGSVSFIINYDKFRQAIEKYNIPVHRDSFCTRYKIYDISRFVKESV